MLFLTSRWYVWLLFMYSFAAVPLLALRLCLQVCLWPRPTTEREEQAADSMTAHSAFQDFRCSLCLGFEQVQRGGSQGLLSIRCGDQSDGVVAFGLGQLSLLRTEECVGVDGAAIISLQDLWETISLIRFAATAKLKAPPYLCG